MNNPVICLRSLASIAAIVASALGFQSISYGESPAEAGKIYWTEAKDFGWIQRAELDGANVESVLTTELTIAPHHLALDWWGEGKIYWTERNGESDISTIRRADRDGNNVETLFMGAEQITAIALDPFGGKMYWATWNPGTILRADLDGFNVETLLTGIGNPSGIVLDAYVFTVEMLSGGVPASKMYWTEYDTGTIRRADLDGSDLDGFNIETLVTEIRNPLGIALDWPFQDVHEHVEQKMYWTEKEAGVIRRADLDGFNIETLVTAEESIIAFSLQLGRWGGMFWTEWNRESETGTLRWAYVDGTNVEVITEIEAQIVPAANSGTLWLNLDLNTIQRLDGSTISPGIEGPQDIAIDVAQNKMYWTDKWTSTIRRANLDGTQVEDMLTGVEEPEDIALDLDAGRMYWTEWGANAIRRADLDGENAETLVEVEGPQSIALDVTGNKMYWTAQEASFFSDGGVIQRANLNGENAETLLTGLNASEGIALDLVEGKMYWVHRRTEILRANLDGSSLESLVSSRAEALVLDVVSGKMYWTNKKGGSIHRADLDGENVEEIVSGLVRPVGIALDVPPPATTPDMADITQTPNPDPCSNGLVVPNPLQNPSLVEDCRALLAFRNSWNRDYVRHMHWDAASRISYWTGIEVHDSRVKYISISEYSLHFEPRPRISGPLSPELGQLTELESLSLPLQGLTGLIPPELGQLTKLKVLNFYHNKLTGPIPPELSQLTELKSLDLGDNQLTGPIPPELGQLTNLTWLGLYRNKLTGPIPPELSQLTELKSLDLGDNQLTGSIPPELGQLTKLWYLRLDGNLLTGPIPSELSQLTNLERLYLNNNSLTGPIPSELSQLTNLQELDLHDNQFTCVPEALSKWADDLPICTNATDPTDWVATPDFDSDGQVGFADFFLFADHFGSSDARFDLDDSGVTDFADFFLFADHFDPPARAKLVVLAQELIGLPDNPQLQQNAPNPFNSQTVLSYFLHASGPARLEVFSLTGQRVAVLRQGPQQAGYHRLHWDGRDAAGHPAASGMYRTGW